VKGSESEILESSDLVSDISPPTPKPWIDFQDTTLFLFFAAKALNAKKDNSKLKQIVTYPE